MQTRDWGWFSPFTISLLLIGAFLLILLYKVDRKTDDPYLDFTPSQAGMLSLFRILQLSWQHPLAAISIGFILTPSSMAAIAEIPPERRGLATATISMMRQFGAILGLAIFGATFLYVQSNRFAKDLKRNTEIFHLIPQQFQGFLSQKPKAVEALSKLSTQSQAFVKNSFTHFYIDSFWMINLISSLITLCGLALTLLLIRRKNRPETDL